MKALLIVLALIELLNAIPVEYEKRFSEFPMANESLYTLLNVSTNADEEQILNSFESLAQKFHPGAKNIDRKTAERKLNIMTAAKELLLDAELRTEYDATLSRPRPEIFTQSGELNGLIGIKRVLWPYWRDWHHESKGKCFWHYEGLIWWHCKPICPTNLEHQTSVISIKDASRKDEFSRDYGKFCMTGHKRRCCTVDRSERFYSGIWKYTGPEGDNRTLNCAFRGRSHGTAAPTELVPEKCGLLVCSPLRLLTGSVLEDVKSEITGEHCDKVKIFGREATATPGLITFNAEGSQKDYLVKIH
ncbi:dnaJ domain-containing protein [Ditylenchus destructor]|nr:dnaJ domain-containing protein [Ditylenchus destructor]